MILVKDVEIDVKVKEAEEKQLQAGIQHLIENSEAFAFLKEEDELYTLDDLKENEKTG